MYLKINDGYIDDMDMDEDKSAIEVLGWNTFFQEIEHACADMITACAEIASIQGRLIYGLVPIAGVIVHMRFKLPRIWVIVLRT